MENNFRICGYAPQYNLSFVIDCYNKVDALWKFSAYVKSKGCNIIEANKIEDTIDINLNMNDLLAKGDITLKALGDGMPNTIHKIIDGITYRAIEIEGACYIPNKNITV